MGSITYDFLNDSIFFNDSSIESKFKNESEERLLKELDDYRQFCLNNLEEIKTEILKNKSQLKVFSSLNNIDLDFLKQTALYVEQFVLSDPLFPLTRQETENSITARKFFGIKDNQNTFKTDIYIAANYLKQISPMVAGDYTKIFPLSFFNEPPKDIPIYPDLESVTKSPPKEIYNFIEKGINIYEYNPRISKAYTDRELKPTNSISIRLESDDKILDEIIQFLVDIEFIKDKDGNDFIKSTLREEVPDDESFYDWVHQEKNKAIGLFYKDIIDEFIISYNLNSNYICNSKFTFDLLNLTATNRSTVKNNALNEILNINVPFLNDIDINQLMNVRNNSIDIFENFREAFERGTREIRLENNKDVKKKMIDNFLHELNDVQVPRITRNLKQMKSKILFSSTIGIGSICMGLEPATVGILPSIISALTTTSEIKNYFSEIKNNPAYFLWKVQKK